MTIKTTTVLLEDEDVKKAKELKINISKVCREAIKRNIEALQLPKV